MKDFNIFGVHQKIKFLGGNVLEKPIYMGTWTVCRFKGAGDLARKNGWCF